MKVLLNDTVAAPITAPGPAGVAIIRISGSRTREILPALSPRAGEAEAHPRTLVFSPLLDPETSEVLDHGLLAFFPAPGSFTGEDSAELHVHGSPYVVRRLLAALGSRGVRGARPGEFSERAFHNGKLDLAQAEAVAALVSAETELQARVAREQLEGRLSQAISDLGSPLRDLLAEIEAGIDFPEEGIDPAKTAEWRRTIQDTRKHIAGYVESYRTGRICREGASVVIAGLPNAGKSSLLNRLVGDERAIVTPIAGTTRDTIEEWVSLDGMLVRLWDTAGLPGAGYKPEPIEARGIEISWKKIAQADLVLYIHDATRPFEDDVFEKIRDEAPAVMLVVNKIDAPDRASIDVTGVPRIEVSALTGAGMSELKVLIPKTLLDVETLASRGALITTERHRTALLDANVILSDALAGIAALEPAELTALSIRSALNALNDILGVTTTEDILGRIFSKFCIGK